MSNIDSELFLENSKLISGTITIGHRMVAESINNYLRKIGYPISDKKEEWKYYMNLAGEYHQSDKDYISKINEDGSPYIKIKLGGLSGAYEVDFTKELLHSADSDPTISVAYRFGSRGYNSLVNKYPKAIELIRGILYPIEKEVSMNVEDGSILQCAGYIRHFDPVFPDRFYFKKANVHTVVNFDMIDAREISIINDLEVWIKNYFSRWLVKDYVFFNEFYIPTLLGLLYSVLPSKINLLRLQRVGTFEVNKYHVKQKLNDIGNLGRFVDIIPEKVFMWLYRNAEYLDVGRNRSDILDKLIENVLDPLKVPIDEHYLVLNSNEENKYYNLLPGNEVLIHPLNKWRQRTVPKRSMVEFSLEKEKELATDNYREYEYEVDATHRRMTYSENSNYRSKLLESVWEVQVPENAVTFEEFLISYWVYNSAKGNIGGHVFIRDPKTNEAIPMTNEAALYIAIYLYLKGYHDITPKRIPTLGSLVLPKATHFTLEDYEPYPDLIELAKIYKDQLSYEDIKEIAGDLVPKYRYSSSFDFFENATKLWKDLGRRYLRWSVEFNPYKRAYLKRLTADFYWQDVSFSSSRVGYSYKDLINAIGINIEDLTAEDAQRLYHEVIRTATGNQEMTNEQYRKLHTALIEIVKHFTSYAVHIVHTTIVGATQVKNEPVVRSFVEEVFAEFMVDVELPSIDHSVTMYSGTAKDGDNTLINVDVPLTIINHDVNLATDKNGLPTLEINNSLGRLYSDVSISETYLDINLSPIVSEHIGESR